MRFDRLENYERGWIVGDFEPSIYKTSSNDIGIIFAKKGDVGDGHYHLHHNEFNLIIDGSVRIENTVLKKLEIFIYEPNDKSFVEFIEDTTLLVFKNPSTKNDKFYDTNIT
jgi:quercetin dioxygenase-like cupin family protein